MLAQEGDAADGDPEWGRDVAADTQPMDVHATSDDAIVVVGQAASSSVPTAASAIAPRHSRMKGIGHLRWSSLVNSPGGSEYTGAVGIAVAKALAGEAKPQEAMDEAAAKWEEITDRLGRDTQKKAYVESMTLAKENL